VDGDAACAISICYRPSLPSFPLGEIIEALIGLDKEINATYS
jgi:hypothetical protein